MPCATFATKMGDSQFVKRYRRAERPGFYCRVIAAGELEAGMRVERLADSGNRVTMPQMMRDYGKSVSGGRLSAYLSAPIHHGLRASLAIGKVKL